MKKERLYSEEQYEMMEKERLLEILRADPERDEEVLEYNGIDAETFHFFEKPANN